jgi:hypothetical protein
MYRKKNGILQKLHLINPISLYFEREHTFFNIWNGHFYGSSITKGGRARRG